MDVVPVIGREQGPAPASAPPAHGVLLRPRRAIRSVVAHGVPGHFLLMVEVLLKISFAIDLILAPVRNRVEMKYRSSRVSW